MSQISSGSLPSIQVIVKDERIQTVFDPYYLRFEFAGQPR